MMTLDCRNGVVPLYTSKAHLTKGSGGLYMGLELVEIFAGREGLPCDTFNVIVTQGGVKASNQAFFAEWLAQKIDRSGL